MKEITVSRKTITTIIWTLIIAVILTGALTVLHFRPDLMSEVASRIERVTPIPATDSPDAQAAAAGVTAFYSLDYTVPVGLWEDGVCATLTTSGCEVFKALYSPGLRLIGDRNRWQTNCSARIVKMVEDAGERRVWLLEATLDHPLPGSPASFQVYAEVAKDTDEVWRMTHVLNDGEADRFASTAP